MSSTLNSLMNAANSTGQGMGGSLLGQQNSAAQHQAMYGVGFGNAGYVDPFEKYRLLEALQKHTPEPKGRITIVIDEVSNGHLIKIGNITRVAPFTEDLMEHVGAAFTQAKMESENNAK